MTSVKRVQTSFTAGELAPTLRGRRDTNLYYAGAETLRNCITRPQGSSKVRPGLRYFATVHNDAVHPGVRLIDFVFNTAQTYVLAVYHTSTKIYRTSDAVLVATLATPWLNTELADIDFVQVADTCLIVHPNYPMQQIQRQVDDTWTLEDFEFSPPPQHKYWSDTDTTIQITGSLTAGTNVLLTAAGGASNGVFTASQVGETWMLAGSGAKITARNSATTAHADLLDDVDNSLLFGSQKVHSRDWTQQAATVDHGYFRSVVYHQDRLWLGGTRDAPYQLWGSRVAAPYDFQIFLNGITDADPIKVGVSTGRLDPIRYLVGGSGGLEIFTSGGEGYMPATVDQPLSPKTIAFIPQTAFGSRGVKPARIAAQTLFVQRERGAVRQFIYSNVQQAYAAEPITVRAAHLVDDPVALTVVPGGFGLQADFLVVVNGDGTGAIMTSEPTEEVRAWADFAPQRFMVDARAVTDTVFVVTKDAGGSAHFLEWLDTSAIYDSQQDGVTSSPGVPQTSWSGFSNLAGLTADLWADGYWRGPVAVSNAGTFTVPAPGFLAASVGLTFDPVIKPMPPEMEQGSLVGMPLRPVYADVMYLNTAGLRVGGQKVPDRPFDDATETTPTAGTDVKRVWLRGWRRDGKGAPVITREGPFPFEILQLAVTYKVGG